MKTIAIIGQKGGTGKTTLAKILLVAFDRAGLTVAGIDLDPQTSLTDWHDMRDADHPAVFARPAKQLPKALEDARKDGVEVCIIDTAGRAEIAAQEAASAADVVIVPVQATADDLMTIPTTCRIIKNAQPRAAFAVLMRVKPQGTRHLEAVEFIKSQGLDVCPAMIGERVTYQDAATAGLSPQEYDSTSRAAIECSEVHSFISDILNIRQENAA